MESERLKNNFYQNTELSPEVFDALSDIVAEQIINGLTDSQIESALENEFGISAASATAQLIAAGRERLNEAAKESNDLTPTELAALIDPSKDLSPQMVYNMARGFINQGIEGPTVLDEVTKLINKKLPNLSREEVSVAFSSYGMTKYPGLKMTLEPNRKLAKKLKNANKELRAAKGSWHDSLMRLYMKSPAGRELKLSISKTALWIVGALLIQFWIGNPLTPLPLIWRGNITNGNLVDVVETEVEDDRGNVGTRETYVYSYLVRGRTFQTAYDSGQLRPTEKVKYLPETPSIARIDGVGWWHRAPTQVARDALLNIIILFIPLCIAFVIASDGIKKFKKNSPRIVY